jgi:hypothetical protein
MLKIDSITSHLPVIQDLVAPDSGKLGCITQMQLYAGD